MYYHAALEVFLSSRPFWTRRSKIHFHSSKDRREMEGEVHHDDTSIWVFFIVSFPYLWRRSMVAAREVTPTKRWHSTRFTPRNHHSSRIPSTPGHLDDWLSQSWSLDRACMNVCGRSAYVRNISIGWRSGHGPAPKMRGRLSFSTVLRRS
jgi:hypothetical protein